MVKPGWWTQLTDSVVTFSQSNIVQCSEKLAGKKNQLLVTGWNSTFHGYIPAIPDQ